MENLYTLTQLAERFGEARDNLVYLCRSRKIKPKMMVGQTHLYGKDAIAQIRKALKTRQPYNHKAGKSVLEI